MGGPARCLRPRIPCTARLCAQPVRPVSVQPLLRPRPCTLPTGVSAGFLLMRSHGSARSWRRMPCLRRWCGPRRLGAAARAPRQPPRSCRRAAGPQVAADVLCLHRLRAAAHQDGQPGAGIALAHPEGCPGCATCAAQQEPGLCGRQRRGAAAGRAQPVRAADPHDCFAAAAGQEQAECGRPGSGHAGVAG